MPRLLTYYLQHMQGPVFEKIHKHFANKKIIKDVTEKIILKCINYAIWYSLNKQHIMNLGGPSVM